MNHVLVTGATGNVGARLVRLLVERGVPVRAFVRDRDTAITCLGPAVDLVVGDFGDPDSLRAAMEGVEQVFLACPNHPMQLDWETAVIDAAAAAGVRRIVKLSAIDAQVGSPVAFADAHGRIEEHLRKAGLAHVLLRPTFSMANLLGGADGVRQAGAIFLPGGGAKVAMIDPGDVARVAAVALTGDGHDGRCYQLTGPEAITFDDVAEQLSAVVGRPIGFVPVPDDAALAQLVGAGMPEWLATNMVRQFGLLRQGAQAESQDRVRVLTGREARSIGQWARDHAAAFRS